ncbi:probable enoyl-CoA hydratase/isomerase [Erythrobacter sp. NAP1]|uniref:crotonase/enoyl-CoA hydratase family protein n=1 Tax=Erythrobacter sp. NAP1 TaxID=237727 RepID=UPI0000686930|nr:crotonase/enoyl-CoA hydratase family protein [Erythrobacter sp. NAP1]EAQ30173.1 probable enoyl-CoA hydratase/isomerase [Erythrobacter sp. NAP1]
MITHSTLDGSHILTMDDGKVNALNKEKLDALVAALAECAQNQAPVAIRGRKGIFSAGFDLKGFAAGPEAATAQLQGGKDALLAILRHPAPVVTLCEGHAYPMGAFLMLASDRAIGTEGNFVTGMNESAIGMALPIYPMILGGARLNSTGRKAVATSQMFSPSEAREVGYFDLVVGPDEVEETIAKTLAELKKLNPGAFHANKSAMNKQLVADIEASPLPDFG